MVGQFDKKNLLLCILTMLLVLVPNTTIRAQNYSQLVMGFGSQRPYEYQYNAAENTLLLTIKNTQSHELKSIDQYDERLVRRIVIKDLAGSGVELKVVLRDRNVQATVADFNEPFRIVVDLYDANYSEQKDQITGLPGLGAKKAMDVGSEKAALDAPRLAAPSEQPAPPSQGNNREGAAQGRRLLQPMPQEFQRSDELTAALNKMDTGPGKSWSDYPVYIYRIQTATMKTDKNYDKWLGDQSVKAMSSSDAMADYAASLFNFGHESKALIAYQQVLHKSPQVFSQNPQHLWNLAEIHLGQGNLLLADGYYQSEIEKHADSPFARFAELRRLDIRAVKAIRAGDTKAFSDLIPDLEKIRPGNSSEVITQIAIRRAYWQPSKTAELEKTIKDRYFIPSLEGNNKTLLERSYKNAEHPWTTFLAATLLMQAALDQQKQWTAETTQLASFYMEQYKGSRVEPFRDQLTERMKAVLNQSLQDIELANQHLAVTNLYESLPPALKKVTNDPKTQWYMGEAYRNLGQPEQAVQFYGRSAPRLEGIEQVKAYFWLAIAANDSIELNRRNTAKQNELKKIRQFADREVAAKWDSLKPNEKQTIYTILKPDLEATVQNRTPVPAAWRIVLSAWERVLGTEVAPNNAEKAPDELAKIYSPTQQSVKLFTDLATRFGEMGLKTERQRTLKLLTRLKPSQLDSNPELMKSWAKELTGLAENLRDDNNYLESGRIYTLIGNESTNFDGRAEAFYKGGLLLYRSGRREEAIAAFKKAAEDSNNLMYADLAKARLNQLQQ